METAWIIMNVAHKCIKYEYIIKIKIAKRSDISISTVTNK